MIKRKTFDSLKELNKFVDSNNIKMELFQTKIENKIGERLPSGEKLVQEQEVFELFFRENEKESAYDEILYFHYKLGWDECPRNIQKEFDHPMLKRAYNIGWSDYIIGDDVRSVDYQTKEQILRTIKNV